MTFEITADKRNDLLNPRYTRKERMKRVVDWFLRNRYPPPPRNYSLEEFATKLSRPLRSYQMVISGQNIWTYRKMRNLPLPDKFRTMIVHIDNNVRGYPVPQFEWQYEFAKIILEILESEDE